MQAIFKGRHEIAEELGVVGQDISNLQQELERVKNNQEDPVGVHAI
jgi:hypothetical protein